jgi:hypothetical protein
LKTATGRAQSARSLTSLSRIEPAGPRHTVRRSSPASRSFVLVDAAGAPP